MICPFCGNESDDLGTICGTCGNHTGFPNVRLSEFALETEALDDRYSKALIDSEGKDALTVLSSFEKSVASSSVVFAMNTNRLRAMATKKVDLYSNYDLAVRAQTRRLAATSDDQHRRAVDAKLWGAAASDIRYGALSLDGRGFRSYGNCFVALIDRLISHRASVLERNSFDFLENVKFGQELPVGYRSNWKNRSRVAVCKCEPFIEKTSKATSFPSILLKSGTTRADDEFIEVHVHGPFDFNAFASITIARGSYSKADRTSLAISMEYAKNAGKAWRED